MINHPLVFLYILNQIDSGIREMNIGFWIGNRFGKHGLKKRL